jgi:hypothetical protein
MFQINNAKNFHVQYADVHRHWSPRSEQYAGGDCLLTAVLRGWEVSNRVEHEQIMQGAARSVNVYHFHMRKGDREIRMPVIENPYVTRLLFTSPFDVVQVEAGTEAAS